ncbi:MAG: hypothetical protein ABI442_15795, partial [Gemmatimonadaceae bacterium]
RIREHPKNSKVLVIAHSRGVHFSNDGGATWNSLATNMPTVPSNDIVFQERDNSIVVGTHGRGIWVLDDAGPLEGLNAETMAAPATLMPMPHARLMSTFAPQAWYGAGEFFAPNPEWTGSITYHLRDAAASPAAIVIADANGKTLRTLKGPASKGINHVAWDLRLSPPVDSANMPPAGGRGGGRGGPPAAVPIGFPAGGEGGGGRGNAPIGPLVLPGKYWVKVTVPGISAPLSGTLTVDGDPLPKFSATDRAARQVLLMRIYEWTKSLGVARTTVRGLLAQRDSIKADLVAGGAADAATKADSLSTRVFTVSAELDRAFNAVNAQRAPIEGWSGMPTADVRSALGYAVEDATKATSELNKLIGADIPAAYKSAKKDWTKKPALVATPSSAASAKP